MLMSTTDKILGYKIKAYVGIGYGIGKQWEYTDAMEEAIKNIEKKYKDIPNIGIVGLHHSVACDTNDDESVISVMGTYVMIEKE